MASRRRVVVASKNPDKIREVEAVLEDMDHPWEIVRGLDWPDVNETETTLEGNALLKALAVSEATGLTALGDDTGLEVDALDGRPGVFSARFTGRRPPTNRTSTDFSPISTELRIARRDSGRPSRSWSPVPRR